MNFKSIYTIVLLWVPIAGIAQKSGIRNNYVTDKNIPHLPIESSMVYQPDNAWTYSHHASITYFKNTFVAIWSNGLVGEDQTGQRILFSTSTDFYHWSKPRVLANPSLYNADTLNVLTAAGFHQFNETLVAYYGEYSPHKTNTHLWASISTDGEQWSQKINMHVSVNPNHGPEKLKTAD